MAQLPEVPGGERPPGASQRSAAHGGDPRRPAALVTGASGGVGRAVAIALAGAGFPVGLAGRDRTRLEEAAAEAEAHGVPVAIAAADLAAPGEAERSADLVAAALGPVGVLVNAAGTFGRVAPFAEAPADDWLAVIDVNLVVPLRLCRVVLPGMLARRWGRIVNVSSAAAVAPPQLGNGAYAVSKAALGRLTRQIAAEVADSGVTANLVHPGDVRTRMWAAIREAAATAGPAGEGLRAWADAVDRTGGDPPERAGALVLELVRDGTRNGEFAGLPAQR